MSRQLNESPDESNRRNRRREKWWLDHHNCLPPKPRYCLKCGKQLGANGKIDYCYAHRHLDLNRKEYCKPFIAAWWQSEAGIKKSIRKRLRKRALEQGFPFEEEAAEYLFRILPQDFLQSGFEADCGHWVKFYQGRNRRDSATVDKMVPSEGYIVGNVHWLCNTCNASKFTKSWEEFNDTT